MTGEAQLWYQVLAEIIDSTHLATGDDLPRIVGNAAAKVGIDVEMYLVDHDQERLLPVHRTAGPALGIDSTLAGRAFRFTTVSDTVDHTGRAVLWLPLLDGTERLGVLWMRLPDGADPHSSLRQHCEVFAGLVGHLVMTKFSYSDLFHVLRRGQQLSVASELLWQLLPPQTFACQQLVITAIMEPYAEVGGDGFDYAVDDMRARIAVFDAVGHQVDAGLTCALALAGTRNARRGGADLPRMATLADEVITGNGRGSRFVTALLAELMLETGVLRYVNAGHPQPLLLRSGRAVKTLDGGRRVPLGLGHLVDRATVPGAEQLEPGDRLLLYTDGVTEAKAADGTEFGIDRLVDLTERNSSAGLPAAETLRRLSRAVLDHQRGRPQDDATLLLMEWTGMRRPPAV